MSVAAGQIFHERDADVGAIDGCRCGQKPVQQLGALGRLHRYREAQILIGLFADGGDRGHWGPVMPRDNVLDVLGPNGGKSGDNARAGGGFQVGPARGTGAVLAGGGGHGEPPCAKILARTSPIRLFYDRTVKLAIIAVAHNAYFSGLFNWWRT